ncbi:hypothetical protein HUU05_23380 [candidate division KSB1 bacterium]|nr:hypothetical protein [candidate division KSB1 bacterium]
MKRLCAFIVVLIAVLGLFGFAWLRPAPEDAPIQFKGFVTYHNGNPAPAGTIVEAYLGGVPKGQTTLQLSNGYYELTGTEGAFTTGTYTLQADDGVGMLGENQCYKVQGTTETVCNIELRTAY